MSQPGRSSRISSVRAALGVAVVPLHAGRRRARRSSRPARRAVSARAGERAASARARTSRPARRAAGRARLLARRRGQRDVGAAGVALCRGSTPSRRGGAGRSSQLAAVAVASSPAACRRGSGSCSRVDELVVERRRQRLGVADHVLGAGRRSSSCSQRVSRSDARSIFAVAHHAGVGGADVLDADRAVVEADGVAAAQRRAGRAGGSSRPCRSRSARRRRAARRTRRRARWRRTCCRRDE